MSRVRPIPPEAAGAELQREYDDAMRRVGRLWGIIAVQSHNPAVLRDSIRLYRTVMFGESLLSRAQREMIAVVTSQANDCHY